MKKLFFYLLLIGFITIGTAQEVTQLEEAKVILTPNYDRVISNNAGLSFTVKENYNGEFLNDPIGFMNENFDIHNFMKYEDEAYDSYLVTFDSSNGYLRAEFDKDGKLVRNQQLFKNIYLPSYIINKIYKENQGWQMVKNKYVAMGDKNVDKAFYRIKLKKGNQSRNLKLDIRPESISLAEIKN